MKTTIKLILFLLLAASFVSAQDLDAIYERGSKNLESGNYEQCVADFKSYIAKRPSVAEANYNLGVCYGYLDKHLDAIDAFREAVRIKPAYYKAYVQLGNELDIYGSYGDAVIAYTKAIKLEPDNSSAYLELAVAQNNAKEYTAALGNYKAALRLDADNVSAIYGIGLVQYNLKNRIELTKQIDILRPLDDKKAEDLQLKLLKLGPVPPGITKPPVAVKPVVKTAQRIKDEKDVAAMADFGFDGALVTGGSSIRETPAKLGKVLLAVTRNQILSLVDKFDSNGFYRVVEEKSGVEGWIDGNAVVIKLTGNTEDTGPPINDDGASESVLADPTVSISNGETKTTLKMRLNGVLYLIPPQSTKVITVKAGKFTYYGWSPGIRPATGKSTLEKGRRYSWSFKIYRR